MPRRQGTPWQQTASTGAQDTAKIAIFIATCAFDVMLANNKIAAANKWPGERSTMALINSQASHGIRA
ncbi:MAG: hypothetical protein QGH25_11555 [Candidatus Latescibacteria bacterium]|nr:hypothetical protein [Candidatus Latescibacterota bacterium]